MGTSNRCPITHRPRGAPPFGARPPATHSAYVLARNRAGDVLFVGHGAVGTLLFCHYSGFAIDRAYDQPAGGGQYFAFVKDGRRVLHSWRRMEYLPRA